MRLLALVVAVLAEFASLALLAVSGWYLAACALAGLGLLATFSYPIPSGIVRLLALTRIGAGYGQNVLLHAVALEDTTRRRLQVFDAVAASRGTPDDRQVDRLLTDATVQGERVIRVSAPLVLTAAAILGALLVGAFTFPWAGLALGLGCAAVLAIALLGRDTDPGEGALRAEILAGIEAAPELDSLGAAPALRARIGEHLAEVEAREHARDRAEWRRRLLLALAAGATFGATLLVAGATAAPGPGGVPLFVMFAGLAFGVTERVHAIGELVPELARLRGAAVAIEPGEPRRAGAGRPRVDGDGAIELPGLRVPAGGTAIIRGPSGVGKTTLLRAVAAEWPGEVAFVADDEFLFTGTVASNLRLGAPDLGDEDIAAACAAVLLAPDITPDTRTGVGGRPLSRGEGRRLMIVRAVLSAPSLLLVDEADLGLDAEAFAAVVAFMRSRLPSATIIYSTHGSPPEPAPTLVLGSGGLRPLLG